MGDESDDVSETSSQKQSYNDVFIENESDKSFSCCSRKCGVVICAFCEKIMHKSCAKRMEYIKFIDEFHINCCQSSENIRTLLQKSEVEIDDQGINLDQTGASNSEKQTPHTKEPEVVWTKVQKKKSEKQKSNLLCMGSRQVNPESKIRGALRRK
ncbi:hypothetical protein WA026_014116 [Henosepilachna vigintioctopunctata]|uniref:Uncharacterized protein n=1 Tax=Henosepilachna vigintioctopunctata TaxID=420089 RepID=A0AAW1TTC7_9CUCU